MSVRLLIDGYNLLHATGAISRGRGGKGQLAQARERLLRQMATALSDDERMATQIVFDAHRTVKGDDEQVVYGMTVTYSVGYEEADDLLEQIIRQHPQPRTLTVVSSDLRVQRTAKARKAQVFTSDAWLMQLVDKTPPKPKAKSKSESKSKSKSSSQAAEPTANETQTAKAPDSDQLGKQNRSLSADEVAQWLSEFGLTPDSDEPS